MRLGEYCRSEPGFLLLPAEHLSASGCDAELAGFLGGKLGWSRERVALLDRSLALYWSRSTSLAGRTQTWPFPRIRNIGIATDGVALRPYAQVLNTSTWTLYENDLDPERSHPELVAYLLALGDWMAMTGEVTEVPMRSAAWWFEVDSDGQHAFGAAATLSSRPDADAIRAVAEALPWLGRLRHGDLKPAGADAPYREIPATGLQVAAEVESHPPMLVDACRRAASSAVETYRTAWRRSDGAELSALLEWLEAQRPMVVVTAKSGRTVWDRVDAGRTQELASVLHDADGVAVESLQADLVLIDEHSRRFMAALSDADALQPQVELAEGGYAYMHPRRRIIAYNLLEPGMERLSGPPLPYERAMLGARTLHEWGHLADETGSVPSQVGRDELESLRAALAEQLDAAVLECSAEVAQSAEEDLTRIAAGRPAGEGLADLLLARLPDYRANLAAGPFMSAAERETYVRHNIRTLRYEYPAAKLWRMLVRYLYEYQYLLPNLGLSAGLSEIESYRYFAMSTGFEGDVVATCVLGEERFQAITASLSRLCSAYAVDPAKLTVPARD